MSKKLPYPPEMSNRYPPGVNPERRRIKSCSERGAWYKNKVGDIVTVHYFASFGAYDTEGRWLWYYDLSAPITDETQEKPKSLFKRIFG